MNHKAALMQNLRSRLTDAGLRTTDNALALAHQEIPRAEELAQVVFDTVAVVQSGLARSMPAIDVKIDWGIHRSRSRGGQYKSVWRSRLNDHTLPDGPGINLCMPHKFGKVKGVRFSEYTHMAWFGDIGARQISTVEEGLVLVTLHECSHSIDFTQRHKAKISVFGTVVGLPARCHHYAHGVRFMRIYSALRRHFGLVDESQPMSSTMTDNALGIVERWRRLPADPMACLKDPGIYRREQRRRQQQERRTASKHAG